MFGFSGSTRATQLRIRGRQEPNANTIPLVFGWLRDQRKGKWVLVLDGLDDDGFLHKIRTRSHDWLLGVGGSLRLVWAAAHRISST
jgi:hypothetical protein